ncbi:hypothetical protein BT69DRAFT_1222459, partial [Atractiella rhizophila]
TLYSKPEPPKLLVQEQLPLQNQIRDTRLLVQDYYKQATEQARGLTDRWIRWERGVEDEVHRVLPKDEKLTPGILYVGVSFLAGSLVARGRSFPIRLLLPPTFLVGSSVYFLPKTSQSIRSYYNHHESSRFPDFHKTRQQYIHSTTEWGRNNLQWVQGLQGKAKELTRSAVQEGEKRTGLKLGSLVDEAREKIEKVKDSEMAQKALGEVKKLENEAEKTALAIVEGVKGKGAEAKDKLDEKVEEKVAPKP